MNKSTILDYTRSRLYMMGSNAAPSFTDESLYPFLDRAQQIVINQAIQSNRLDLISQLIENKTSFSDANVVGGVWTSHDIDPDNFFRFISGKARIVGTVGGVGTPSIWVPMEQVSIQYFDIIKDKSNRMRFPKPKLFFGYKDTFITVLLDNDSEFFIDGDTDNYKEDVEIKYVTNPDLFSDMEGDQSPKISSQLHLDIVEKAAELTATVLNPQSAAQEIQNNNQAQRS